MKLRNEGKTGDEFSLQADLLQMAKGFVISQCIFAAAKLGIADLLGDGPKHCDDLAAATDAHSDSLCRLLRVLAAMGVFEETEPECFQMTPLATCLQEDDPGSVRNFILLRADQDYACWGNLMYSLRTGKSAFEHTYGMNRYQYNQQNAAAGERFDLAMSELAVMLNAAVVAAYDFSGIKKIAELGGGQGSLLAAILQACPALKGILFDQPDPIEKARYVIEKEGVADRCELVSGDLFDSLPAGADAYLLKNVLHNWDEPEAVRILRNCHRVMPEEGRLLVIERIHTPDASLKSNLIDLNMLVMFSSGRIRTEDEFHDLFGAAGFRLTSVFPMKTELSVIEGRIQKIST